MKSLSSKKYPALAALAGVVAGIILADFVNLPTWLYLFVSLCLFVISVLSVRSKFILPGGLLVVAGLVSLSAFNYNFRFKTSPPGHVSHFADDNKIYTIYGTVNDWPTLREKRTEIPMRVDSVEAEGVRRRAAGGLLLRIGTETTRIQFGDRVIFESSIRSLKGGPGPSGFNYRRYLNLKGIFATAFLPNQFSIQVDPVGERNYLRLTGKLRQSIVGVFKETLDSNAAAMAAGFLIGETKDISKRIYTLFRDSGTLHLLAVSGSNVALVVLLFSFLLRGSPLSLRKRTFLLLIIIVTFSFLAYNQPSVVRAAIMAAMILLGKMFQRKIEYNNIIAATALIILIFEPTELFDIGFQLSFVTAWGLIFLLPMVSGLFRKVQRKSYYRFLIFPLLICLVAQIASIPLSAYYFHRVTLFSFLSNLIIVPLVSIILAGEIVLLLAALILPILGNLFGSLLNPVINWTLTLLEFFAPLNNSIRLDHQFSGPAIVLFYIFIIMAFVGISSRRARRFGLLFLLAAADGILLWGTASARDDARLTVIPVSPGYAAVARAGRTQTILCRMPQRDYSIAEKIIGPDLRNLEIENTDLISLSEDYQTTNETVYLIDSFKVERAYFPAAARNICADLYLKRGTEPDTGKISFYSEENASVKLPENNALLTDGAVIYNLGGQVIIVADNDFEIDSLSLDNWRQLKAAVFIKPSIEESDLHFLFPQDSNSLRFVITDHISDRVVDQISGMKLPGNLPLPQIHLLSEVGMAEIVIRNGRLRLIN